MGSIKRNGRNQGPDRRRSDNGQRRRGFLNMESLESRTLLDAGPNGWKPTSADFNDLRNGPLAIAGKDLGTIYQTTTKNQTTPASLQAQYPYLMFKGDSVGVDIRATGDLNAFAASVRNLGMQVVAASAKYALIDGYLPITKLATAALLPGTVAISPMFKPYTDFVGAANNEAERSVRADVARQTTGLDGTGVTVGVLSDSVSVFAGGLADSIKTGDLAAGSVNIIAEGPKTGEDEGRAMMENIHDIAPGANFAFATAFTASNLAFGDNIRALGKAGAKVIVDDVRVADDAYFQDGLIQQGINDVVAQNNVTYFSSAGNQSVGNGYLSTFRPTDATVTGVGTGRFMNFAPSGAANALLPITTNGQVQISFQFDQPFFTQEPNGSRNDVTSQVNIYALDAAGKIVASGTNNNVATHEPFQSLLIPASGSYNIAIQVVSGPDPGHVEFVRVSNGPDNALQVSQQYGAAGGTFYPTSAGHKVGQNTIGVGAVPWWATPPYLGQNPLKSEPFSSSGPGLSVRNPDGSLKGGSGTLMLAPSITAADGGNTSFFGEVIDTSKPPFPGQPATPTNLSQNLPSFFGTSSSSPNAAAVGALLKQRNPTITNEQVRAALIASAASRPLNGAQPGTYDLQGGFGLIDANAALASIDVLRVSNTAPAPGGTSAVAPTVISILFNKPIDFSTLRPGDLVFTALPPGVTVSVGAPVAINDPRFPTLVDFPVQFNVAPGASGNGVYTYSLASPAGGPQVVSFEGPGKAGKPLQPFTNSFAVADVAAPRVVNTTVSGRIVTVQFSEPMAPSTINAATVGVVRFDAAGVPVSNLNNDPRFRISYDVRTSTATLDYSGLDQTQLPSGSYAIFVLAGNANGGGFAPGVTDLVGNKLDGEFNGVFPSGDGDPRSQTNPTGRNPNEDFNQFLGFQSISAPHITSLQLLPQSDSGIQGDENTNVNQPRFVGQVSANFPGSVGGLTVLVQFNALHGGGLDLDTASGRGFRGSFDVTATTDVNGRFIINAPFLPEGFNRMRLVVIGQPDSPPLPGLSAGFDHAFRIDNTGPTIVGAAITPGAAPLPLGFVNIPLPTLNTLSLGVIDPASAPGTFLATPAPVFFPALDPATANNISNYTLTNTTLNADESNFIATASFVPTGANFNSIPNRQSADTPYYGRVDLTFTQGLPAGVYTLTAHTREGVFGGLTDAAGNPLDASQTRNNTGGKDFVVRFDIQPQPVFITSVTTDVANAAGNGLLPYSYYEQNPRAGDTVSAPPTRFFVDLSVPLDPGRTYTDALQLIGTANAAGSTPDGDFGTLGQAGLGSSGSGFSRFNPAGTNVVLTKGLRGDNTRLELDLPAGTVLPADHYRLYMPNSGANTVFDIFGNQLDGEFLGNPTLAGRDVVGNPTYEDLLPTGQYRQGMSGDGVRGGAFTTGFIVVPTGNIVYARPDYNEDPLLPSTTPDGSRAKPYSVLAPQAGANSLNSGTLNNGDPNGGLNSSVNFLSGFNPTFDRAGIKKFARSALYAAQQLSTRGPVVVVALPGSPQRDPFTGVTTQQTFVLQAPSGADPVRNDGSASVPFDTTLVFNPGSTLKLRNASLFVQSQGSGLMTKGGPNPNDRVTFTSYSDDSVAGDSNGDRSNTTPKAGDWGGIVFRNFNQSLPGRTDPFQVDGTLQGPGGSRAVSGADDTLSDIDFATIRYGGGAVPATRGTRYDEVTLFNSRPAITNTIFNDVGSSAQATISGDLDSFREDDTTRGPLIRRTIVQNASINGILVRSLVSTGIIQQTNAINYPDNPVTLGGSRNFTFDDPLPYVLASRIEVGTQSLVGTAGDVTNVLNRLYVQPGMMVKSERGAGIQVLTPGSSLIVGDRTYISRWDAKATRNTATGLPTSTYSPEDADFVPNTVGDAKVVFTTALDNTATTSFFDPLTQLTTVIVPAIDSLSSRGAGQPTPNNVPAASRWGSIGYTSGALGTFDEAEVRYGGATLNIAGGTTVQNVLSFVGAGRNFFFGRQSEGFGTRLSVTNNDFFDNQDAPIGITPDGLLAADTIRPLSSGHPFFRGNVFQRNDLVVGGVRFGANGLLVHSNHEMGASPILREGANVTVNSLWDQTDLTYIVRGTIVMGPAFGATGNTFDRTRLSAESVPLVTLTVQSALPDTLLADGQRISRPGESVIVKLDSRNVPGSSNNSVPDETFTETANIASEAQGGAGFEAGVDNGVDPTADPLFDTGVNSQMRFLGIGGNETTGQSRVPVVITSVHDNSVGTTVRGVKMFTAIDGDTTAPAAGDGGLIYFGGLTQTDFNLLDPRDGNLIDNADIRYVTRVEMQGGGAIDYVDLNASNSLDLPDGVRAQKAGFLRNNPTASQQLQNNATKAMTISNSNLSNFRDMGVLVHPGFGLLTFTDFKRNSFAGESTQLFMYNNTVSNMPVGVRYRGQQDGNDTAQQDVTEFVALNNTFYNNPLGVDLISVNFNGTNPSSHIHVVAMDNIFANSKTTAIQNAGQMQGSELQYNLFNGNGSDLINLGAGPGSGLGNDQPVFGDPRFRDPANGNFQLLPDSAAIDASRSELDLNPTANGAIVGTLVPIVTQVLDARGGIRNRNSREPDAGGLFDPTDIPTNILTLPGFPDRGYFDQFVATLPSDPAAVVGPVSVPGTWLYKPIDGERDALGFLRIDDPNKPNVGFGSRPFFDIGAFEFRLLNPPHVTGVTAVVTDPGSPNGTRTLNLYSVGGLAGTNKPIQTIQVTFDHRIDPNTLNERTVRLEGSGGDGIFNNNNSTSDRFYNLAGKLTFDPNTNTLTINVGAAGLNLGNDEYRLFLQGSGSDVIRDPEGNALSGTNTLNDDPNNPQLPLPSGNGFPGGNFTTTFVINTQAPTVVAGSFQLDPGSDSNIPTDKVTNNTKPSYSGTILVGQSQIVPIAGQTVIIDLSTNGDGVFNRLNAGTALTDASGRFLVTVGQDAANTGLVSNQAGVPDSPYNVGPDGQLRTPDDSGYTFARVRVIDQSGNQSNLPTDTNAQFGANGALAGTVIDTAAPHVIAFTPAGNSRITPSGGRVTFSFTADKNIDLASVNANTVLVVRAGVDGILGTKDDVSVPIDANSVRGTFVGGGPKGPERVTFTISGALPNDFYNVTLVGSGTAAITDIAGNPLAGAGGPGSNFNSVYALFSQANVKSRFVGDPRVYTTNLKAPLGTRANPFPTVTAGLAGATTGDVIAVLPGVYTEQIVLRAFVRVLSADPSSTDTLLVDGNPLTTILRAPANSKGAKNPYATVSATNLPSIPGVDTEIAGLTISSPLLGDPALGPIDPASVAVFLNNSDVLVDRDYIVDAHLGVQVLTSGASATTPRILNNGIIGNDAGVLLQDQGAASIPRATPVFNNTFAFNTIGLYATASAQTPLLGVLANNIFWQNHDQSIQRTGMAINATATGKLALGGNLFSGNGPSDTDPSDDTRNVGNEFDPTVLRATPDAFGNFTGNPAFVNPLDPRPGSDGPASFFFNGGASYNLTSRSAAIDNALEYLAPPTDFFHRGRVKIAGKGFVIFGTGPADVGAFEFNGAGGSVSASSVRTAGTVSASSFLTAAASATPAPASVPVPKPATVNVAVDRATPTTATPVAVGRTQTVAVTPPPAASPQGPQGRLGFVRRTPKRR